MKYFIGTLTFLFLCSYGLLAQDDATLPGSKSTQEKSTGDAPKGFVHLAIGSAIPIGDFGDTSLDNFAAGSGYAVPGLNFHLSGGYSFLNGLGVSMVWLGAAHYLEVDGVALESEDDLWSYGGIGLGPMYLGSADKLVYDGHIQVTRFLTTLPTLYTDPDIESVSSIGIVLGGNVNYTFGKCAIGINLDYISTTADFYYLGREQKITSIMFNGSIGAVF